MAIRLDETSRGVPWNCWGVGSELFEKFSYCAGLLLDENEIKSAFSMAESVEQLPHLGDRVRCLSHTALASVIT